MDEIWKDIPGYEGCYQVSNLGQVKSLPGGRRKGQLLRPGEASNGYLTVALWKDGKVRSFTVQSLVISAFVGPQPGGFYIRHKDDCRQNNRLDNLCYGTPSENFRDVYELGHTHRKLTRQDVYDIRRELEKGAGTRKVAEMYGVCERTIRNLREGRTFAWL